MKQFIKKNTLTLIGIPIGTVLGYLYFYFWGCTESCTIRSSPYKMAAYGALMGGLIFNLIQEQVQKRKIKNQKNES